MPNYGSTKQNTGGRKISDGTSGNFDQGSMGGFGGGKGARNRLPASDNGQWDDTDNSMPSDSAAFGVGRPGGGSNPVGIRQVNHSGQPHGSGNGGSERSGMKVNSRGY